MKQFERTFGEIMDEEVLLLKRRWIDMRYGSRVFRGLECRREMCGLFDYGVSCEFKKFWLLRETSDTS